MGRVVDLERARVEALAESMVDELRSRGELLVRTLDVDDVDRWRRAARRTGRILGSRVRTMVTDDGSVAWAVALDYQHDPAQVRAALARLTDQLRLRPPQ